MMRWSKYLSYLGFGALLLFGSTIVIMQHSTYAAMFQVGNVKELIPGKVFGQYEIATHRADIPNDEDSSTAAGIRKDRTYTEEKKETLALVSNVFSEVSKDIKLMSLVDIPIKKYGVFLSCLNNANRSSSEDHFLCIYRSRYNQQGLTKIYLSRDFYLNSMAGPSKLMNRRGEDPRVFEWNDKVYVVDNYLNRMFLYQMVQEELLVSFRIPLSGKNLTPVAINRKDLLFIDFERKQVHKCNIHAAGRIRGTLNCTIMNPPIYSMHVVHGSNQTGFYRGGTAGYEIANGVFIGFGHYTISNNHHDIFFWKLNLNDSRIEISNLNISHDEDHAITDPTSIIKRNGQYYLITAESEHIWFKDQLFVSRIYLIRFS